MSAVVFLSLAIILIFAAYGIYCIAEPDLLAGSKGSTSRWHYIKKIVFLIALHIRKWRRKKDGYELTLDHPFIREMDLCALLEHPQKLQEANSQAVDCMYFNGFDKLGSRLVARIARRPGRTAEIWLMIRLPDGRYFHYPTLPDTVLYNVAEENFEAGGLKFELIEPLWKWRLSFNGLLREGERHEWSEQDGKLVHITFAFTWTGISGRVYGTEEFNIQTAADGIARAPWSWQTFSKLQDRSCSYQCYEQWGSMIGTLTAENETPKVMQLQGARTHSWNVLNWAVIEKYILIYGYVEDGTCFTFGILSIRGFCSQMLFGYVHFPSGICCNVKSSTLKLPEVSDEQLPPHRLTFSLNAESRICKVELDSKFDQQIFQGLHWSAKIVEQFVDVSFNSSKGWGIAEYLYHREEENCLVPRYHSVPLLSDPSLPDNFKELHVIPLEIETSSSILVGGKGTQLALLKHLSVSTNAKLFIVPNALLVTVNMYQLQLASTPLVKAKIQTLHESCNSLTKLKIACDNLVEEISSCLLCFEARQKIADEMEQEFGYDWTNKQFSVRSSAVGEDGLEASSAGMMASFLGVKGSDNLYEAVVKCWASLFSLDAVQYRRNHGQPITVDMGVCIQEMVTAECAGVLFTRDPVTGNPGIMTINVSYGLGEAVVSGVTEPDTIFLKRAFNNRLAVKEKVIGSKKTKIDISDSTEGGTININVAENDASKCCLTDDLALQLGKIGILVEQSFSDPRDIEFAVKDNEIYLLQARPITSFNIESDFEILHEFDAGILSNEELLTTGNTGEVLPRAVTPLTSSLCKMVEFGSQMLTYILHFKMRKIKPIYVDFAVFSLHPFINMLNMMYKNNKYTTLRDTSVQKTTVDLAIFGHCTDTGFAKMIDHRYSSIQRSYFMKLRVAARFIWMVSRGQAAIKSARAMLAKLCIDQTLTEPLVLYCSIQENFKYGYGIWFQHLFCSASSAFWSSMIRRILADGTNEATNEIMSDVACLLSNCSGVISADVPTAIQDLAETIAKCDRKAVFTSLNKEKALEWLISAESGEAKSKFGEFINKHGHRCVREGELREKPWRDAPLQLIPVLQTAVKSGGKKERKLCGINEAIDKVKSPLTSMAKKKLKWFVPRARRAVAAREATKEMGVKCVDIFRAAFNRLADVMVAESRIPDSDLIFFFSFSEIGLLLRTRSAKLVKKALRRRKMLPTFMDLEFPLISRGYPQPIEEYSEGDMVSYATKTKIVGMPVSHGKCQGKCRVVTSLEEAVHIKAGEILITEITDIGWSPYFTLLAGLVTEKGGLLSHGAVVAREYSLPCIVSAKGVLVALKTGDEVILNGTTGTIEKLVKINQASEAPTAPAATARQYNVDEVHGMNSVDNKIEEVERENSSDMESPIKNSETHGDVNNV